MSELTIQDVIHWHQRKAKTTVNRKKSANHLASYELIQALTAERDKYRKALEEAKGFAEWVEILGRTDCEIYKNELKHCADLSIERIDKALLTY